MSTIRVYRGVIMLESSRISTRFLRKATDHMFEVAVRGATGGPYSTGDLVRKMYKEEPVPTGWVTRASVGNKSSHAKVVEEGARVHSIFPIGMPHVYRFGSRRPRQLKFSWRGRIVYTPHVPMGPGTIGRSHPGMTGKHYMLKALLSTAARYRMKPQIYET